MSTSTQRPIPIQIFIHITGGFTVIHIHPTHAAATHIPETMQPSEPTVSADAPAPQAAETGGDAAALNTQGTAAQVPAAGSLGAGDRTVLFCVEPLIDASQLTHRPYKPGRLRQLQALIQPVRRSLSALRLPRAPPVEVINVSSYFPVKISIDILSAVEEEHMD
ncbi:hypothetical protein B0H11DRAFT_1954080, partial [Mycena galericulata]